MFAVLVNFYSDEVMFQPLALIVVRKIFEKPMKTSNESLKKSKKCTIKTNSDTTHPRFNFYHFIILIDIAATQQ